jgi:hypothetical protein
MTKYLVSAWWRLIDAIDDFAHQVPLIESHLEWLCDYRDRHLWN